MGLRILLIIILSFVFSNSFAICQSDRFKRIYYETKPLKSKTHESKNILVFFDGTGNNINTGTNIRRIFEHVCNEDQPESIAIYIEGVGSLADRPLSGLALGSKLEARTVLGYDFITRNYNPGDSLYIFGFSRGAMSARSLAGAISYAGIPKLNKTDIKNSRKLVHKIIEIVKKQVESEFFTLWNNWKIGSQPFLSDVLQDDLEVKTRSAMIKFLGVWDTVPGSSFKKYKPEACHESVGKIKQKLNILPGIDKGERYKTRSYPNIENIAHAVSIDDKRSKFRPLLVCKSDDKNGFKIKSNVEERWFPGAHADIGGGYLDDENSELPSISLDWILSLFKKYYPYKMEISSNPNPEGLAHWSYGDPLANIRSKCEDRLRPIDAIIDPSYERRIKASEEGRLLKKS